AGMGGQFHAKAPVVATHVVLAALEVAEGQCGLVLGGRGLGAAFAGGVVQPQQLVAAAAVLALRQRLALEPGEYGGVLVAVEPARGVAGGTTAATGHLVVRGIVLAAAVVDGANYHRAVDVAL